MNEWIATVLADHECTGHCRAADVLIEEATTLFRKYRYRRYPHTFVLTGWIRRRSDGVILPEIVIVTNALDTNANWKEPADHFYRFTFQLPETQPIGFTCIGVPLAQQREEQIAKSLIRISSGKSPSEGLSRYLSSVIHETYKAKPDHTVSPDNIVYVIPKGVIRRTDATVIAGPPIENVSTFMTFNRKHNRLQEEGPTIVCGKFALSELRVERSRDGNSESASVRLLRFPSNQKD